MLFLASTDTIDRLEMLKGSRSSSQAVSIYVKPKLEVLRFAGDSCFMSTHRFEHYRGQNHSTKTPTEVKKSIFRALTKRSTDETQQLRQWMKERKLK